MEQHVDQVNAAKLSLLAEITHVDRILPLHPLQLVLQEFAVLLFVVNELQNVITLTVVVSNENVETQFAPKQDALLMTAVKLLCTAVHGPARRA